MNIQNSIQQNGIYKMRQNNLVKFDFKKMITPKNKPLRSIGETIKQNKKVTLQPNKLVSNQLTHQNIVYKPAFIKDLVEDKREEIESNQEPKVNEFDLHSFFASKPVVVEEQPIQKDTFDFHTFFVNR